ncbi:hypothetical protein Nepgr_027295 [Nepenthes gracilis]|uniref:Uncharacterized protein n=1 Tax=Nepenthes gracilis TaxID=150966 RepID=A0AAD3Y140_NEPGR|nr:hypothetical protein Nepgr_027295 [Nepenthes gracilis]
MALAVLGPNEGLSVDVGELSEEKVVASCDGLVERPSSGIMMVSHPPLCEAISAVEDPCNCPCAGEALVPSGGEVSECHELDAAISVQISGCSGPKQGAALLCEAGPSMEFSLIASEASDGAGCSSQLKCQDGASLYLAGSPSGRPNQIPGSGSADPQVLPPVEVMRCFSEGVKSEHHQFPGNSGPNIVDGSSLSSDPRSSPRSWASVVEKKAFGASCSCSVDAASFCPEVAVFAGFEGLLLSFLPFAGKCRNEVPLICGLRDSLLSFSGPDASFLEGLKLPPAVPAATGLGSPSTDSEAYTNSTKLSLLISVSEEVMSERVAVCGSSPISLQINSGLSMLWLIINGGRSLMLMVELFPRKVPEGLRLSIRLLPLRFCPRIINGGRSLMLMVKLLPRKFDSLGKAVISVSEQEDSDTIPKEPLELAMPSEAAKEVPEGMDSRNSDMQKAISTYCRVGYLVGLEASSTDNILDVVAHEAPCSAHIKPPAIEAIVGTNGVQCDEVDVPHCYSDDGDRYTDGALSDRDCLIDWFDISTPDSIARISRKYSSVVPDKNVSSSYGNLEDPKHSHECCPFVTQSQGDSDVADMGSDPVFLATQLLTGDTAFRRSLRALTPDHKNMVLKERPWSCLYAIDFCYCGVHFASWLLRLGASLEMRLDVSWCHAPDLAPSCSVMDDGAGLRSRLFGPHSGRSVAARSLVALLFVDAGFVHLGCGCWQ